jgi:hypothetical protein
MRLPALLIGAGIIVVVIAAIVGYQIGNKKERDNWAKNNAGGSGPAQSPAGGNTPTPPATGVIDPLNGGGNGGTLPLDPNAAAGGGVIKPPIPAPAPTTEAGLQDGWNYLVVATLRRTEAEEAARYLNDNQIPVQLVPYKTGGVDRGGGDANNGRWQLWILRGVPPGAFSKTQTERDALKSKIEMLGRTWKAKNRQAPTDFAEAYWQKK